MFPEQQVSILEWFLKEDWSNDAGNSALHHRNKLHFTIYLNRKQLFETVKYFTILQFLLNFYQIFPALVSIRDLLKTMTPNFWKVEYCILTMMIINRNYYGWKSTILNLTINLNNHIILNVSHRGHRLHTLKLYILYKYHRVCWSI